MYFIMNTLCWHIIRKASRNRHKWINPIPVEMIICETSKNQLSIYCKNRHLLPGNPNISTNSSIITRFTLEKPRAYSNLVFNSLTSSTLQAPLLPDESTGFNNYRQFKYIYFLLSFLNC